MKFEISRHAREEMVRRGIPVTVVDAILQDPEQIVNDTVDPVKIVTVYKTSKTEKYWRKP